MIVSARVLIWAFFLLIVDQALVLAASKFGLPVKPAYFYFAISFGLLISAILIGIDPRTFLEERLFFFSFLAIVLIGIILYRGETTGPNITGTLVPTGMNPTAMGYALWPALNLVAGAGLYLLARRNEFRRTIVVAAFVTMLIQIASMEADMWWPSLFGFPDGRSGGLAQNANTAALLLVALASMTLTTRLAPYAALIVIGGVLLSQSRSGVILAVILVTSYLIAERRRPIVRAIPAFATGVFLVVAGTIYFSPVLNPSPETIANAPPTLNRINSPIPLKERIELRMYTDDYSFRVRKESIGFYLGLVRDNPVGFGTGFTNKFEVGPHNTFLKLAVDNGIVSAVLLFVLLSIATWRAFLSRSSMLVSLSLTGWVSSMLSHTLLVDPIVLPALAAGLGFICHPNELTEVPASEANNPS